MQKLLQELDVLKRQGVVLGEGGGGSSRPAFIADQSASYSGAYAVA
ncbi:MAG: hypothetical protein J2P28_09595 [Actinobacteria bacterium]|nr:hypothetical protein [Actinomycetota bacterium]